MASPTDRPQYTAHRPPDPRSRDPLIVTALIALFVGLAIVKPWSGSSDARPRGVGSGSVPTAVAIASPSGRPAVAASIGPNTLDCLAADQEQFVTLERASGREVRSWIVAVDHQQALPPGPETTPIAIYSTHLVGLGLCAPAGPPSPSSAVGQDPGSIDQHAGRLVDIERLSPTGVGPVAVDLGPSDPLPGQASGTDSARLYGPPLIGLRPTAGPSAGQPSSGQPSSGHSGPAGSGDLAPAANGEFWPTGSYALAFMFDSDRSTVVHWIRLQLSVGAADLP